LVGGVQVEVGDAYSSGAAGTQFELDPPLARGGDAEGDAGASVHGGPAFGPPALELASGARLQATLPSPLMYPTS